jgi:hypothetical protein
MAKELKWEIPLGSVPQACRGCGARIYWLVMDSGARMPVDPDGTSHFATCPQANRFRKPKEQQQLFE